MLPAPGNIGRFCSSHLPGETRTLPSPPRLNAWLRAAARLKGAASSTSGRNCWRNALLDTTSTEFPPASLAQEPASTAANPKGLQEPPLPSSCTGYFLLNHGLSIFSQRKACLNSHTPKAGKVCLHIN